MAKNKEIQKRANSIYQKAVKDGRLLRPTCCSECGNTEGKVDGHHEDYSKPLDVVWLCRGCHIQRHRKKPQPGQRDRVLLNTAYLEQVRQINGFTKTALAKKIGISGGAYSQIVKLRSAHPHKIKALIDVLNLDPERFIPESDKLIPDPKEAD